MGEKFYRHTWVEVNLDAISHNLHVFRQHLPERTQIMAVVKADGYGHGAIPVAKVALEAGASYLGVATLDEALELRRAGIHAPILVLGYTSPSFIEEAVIHNIALTVFDIDVISALNQATQHHQVSVKVHLKVDTGMGRIGVRTESELLGLISSIAQSPFIEIEGVFTHFSCADEEDPAYSEQQHHTFIRVIKSFQDKIPIVHCNNSAAGILFPQWGYNMIRLGISLYGQYPSTYTKGKELGLKEAFTLKTKVAQVKCVPKETAISYGATYKTEREATVASIPIGYADGYSRALSNRGIALVQGKEVPIIGRICMDQCMLDVSSIKACSVGDEVVLIGRQGDSTITVDDVAGWMQTINYEVTCMISKRVPRMYKRNGTVVWTQNYLL